MQTVDELAREAVNRYYREWRAKHKDRVREYNRRYWMKKALELKEYDAMQEATQDETNG